jgi:hypothetical protein
MIDHEAPTAVSSFEHDSVLRKRIDHMSTAALVRYHARYDNDLYKRATAGKSVERCNALIDEAMSICGHPRFSVTYTNWTAGELDFLRRFAEEV